MKHVLVECLPYITTICCGYQTTIRSIVQFLCSKYLQNRLEMTTLLWHYILERSTSCYFFNP